MTQPPVPDYDPDRDLLLERIVAVAPQDVWDAWTDPDQIRAWFSPAPVATVDCTIDLRPGGLFQATMQTPDGSTSTLTACYLAVAPPHRLVWTTLLETGYRPIAPQPTLPFTAHISIEPVAEGTRYRAHLMHQQPDHAHHHARQGFADGWSTALDQLVTLVQSRNT